MNVETFTVGAFQENCYLLVDRRSGKAVIVDPGGEGDRLVEAVRERIAADNRESCLIKTENGY